MPKVLVRGVYSPRTKYDHVAEAASLIHGSWDSLEDLEKRASAALQKAWRAGYGMRIKPRTPDTRHRATKQNASQPLPDFWNRERT